MTDSFESDLAELRPTPASADRASFYFRAGQASRDRSVHTWQGVASAALVVLFAAAGVGYWRIADAEARVAEAEARRTQNPIVVQVPAEVPQTPAPSPILIEEDSRPYAPPMAPHPDADDPSAAEVAATLELRRNILTAGTTYLDAQSKRNH
jgi:hypothetical protein